MPIIETKNPINENLILLLRIIAGLVWLGTVFRRLGPNQGDFEDRIISMGEGTTILPESIMEFAIDQWFLLYLLVISIEIISSFSLLTGTLSRGGALLATVNGFAIGMAGIGLGIIDLIIPWSVAFITLFLFLFTHPGLYKGFDGKLVNKNLPSFVSKFI
ncbi:MAG: hypothetical protein HeimC2_29510 [Candidatus Heimdallarchaeota archaeon LC_2]|nr:MAG: hypothetical protein HeimC2_29510 [Candidatus Heimdallarchaeota archaeon LC_2]